MSGYGVREARINKERQPRVTVCGDCGAECNGLLCDDCRGVLGPIDPEMEDNVSYETRTRG